MAQTVIGFFDNANEAQSAVSELLNGGFTRENIDVSSSQMTNADANRSTTDNYYENDSVGDSVTGFFSSLFGDDDKDNARNYSQVARDTDTIVTVHAQSGDEASRAAAILDQYGTVDVDERAAQYRNVADAGNMNRTDTNETSIPIIEEQLQVGKRTVETGGARLRSRIIERPVEETVRLREERVRVERRPVDRAATAEDLNRQTGDIEMTEHSEVAVVGKEARVVEEVSLGKEVTERQETVSDTVRRTDVEVEEIETDGEARRAANR